MSASHKPQENKIGAEQVPVKPASQESKFWKGLITLVYAKKKRTLTLEKKAQKALQSKKASHRKSTFNSICFEQLYLLWFHCPQTRGFHFDCGTKMHHTILLACTAICKLVK